MLMLILVPVETMTPSMFSSPSDFSASLSVASSTIASVECGSIA